MTEAPPMADPAVKLTKVQIEVPFPDFPKIGERVGLRGPGQRVATAYTISSYREFEPGLWVFKASDDFGGGICDGIGTLRKCSGEDGALLASIHKDTTDA